MPSFLTRVAHSFSSWTFLPGVFPPTTASALFSTRALSWCSLIVLVAAARAQTIVSSLRFCLGYGFYSSILRRCSRMLGYVLLSTDSFSLSSLFFWHLLESIWGPSAGSLIMLCLEYRLRFDLGSENHGVSKSQRSAKLYKLAMNCSTDSSSP